MYRTMFRHAVVVCLGVCLMLLSLGRSVSAQDTVLVTYQGYLTDNAGAPITGSTAMTFTIYDALGTARWYESYLAVPVSSGLFNVTLGSRNGLPSSVFDGSERYLGVRVGGDPEMTPRTLLTSAPGAAFSRQLMGDIQTSPGQIDLFDNAEPFEMGGNIEIGAGPDASGLLMTQGSRDDPPDIELRTEAATNAIRLHPPEPCVPPEPCIPALELIATAELHGLKIHPPDPCVPPDPCNPAFEFKADATGVGFYISDGTERMGVEPSPFHPGAYGLMMYDPASASPTVPKFELFCGNTTGAGFNFNDEIGKRMGVEPSPFRDAFSLLMYDPASADAINPKLEMHCGGGTGAGMDIFDDAGKVMGVEPTPFNSGYGIRLYNPNQPDQPPIVDISTAYADGAHGLVNIGYGPPPDDNKPGVQLSSDPEYGKIIVGGPQPMVGGPPKMIMMQATASLAQVGIGTDTPTEALHVVGNVYITGDYLRLTDTKAKSNVLPIVNALDKVDGLRGVTYDLQGEMAEKMEGSIGRQVGFLAQEVEQVLPEAVKTMDDGYKAVDYSRLTALLVEAVKELKAENEDLKSRVAALEKR